MHYPPSVERPDMQAVAAGKAEFVDEMMRAARKNMADRKLMLFFSVMTGESLTEEHPAHLFFLSRYDLARDGFTSAIAEAKGISNKENREKIAGLVSVLFATSDGLQMQWLRNQSVDFLGGLERVGRLVQEELQAISE